MKRHKNKHQKKVPFWARDAFLSSYEWRALRMFVLKKYGARCQCCGATPKKDGITIHVDHIKPRRHFPELALTESNLQVLCEVCNHGKGNWDQTDWRGDAPVQSAPAPRPMLVKRHLIDSYAMSDEEACRLWEKFGTRKM